MKTKPASAAQQPRTLRQRAEATLRVSRTDLAKMSGKDSQRLVNELQVHQIELEMQNEELRRAEAELAESSDRFNDLYDFAPVGYLTLNAHGTVTEANLKVAKMLGLERDQLVGRKFSRCVARAAQDAFYLHQRAVLGGGKPPACELRLLGPEGKGFFARMESVGLLDPATGTPRHVRCAISDNTASRQAAAVLEEREERLRAVLNTVTDAILSIDRCGTITSLNPATERMFSYPEAEMLGQNVRLLLPAPGREKLGRDLARSERTGEAWLIGLGSAVSARRKDGTVFPIELAISEVNHMDLFAAVIRDITERKQLEAEVLRIAEAERERVAADLHDGICQELTGLQYLALQLVQQLKKAQHPLVPQARRIEEVLIGTTLHARQTARGLDPVVADGHGLMHALRQLAENTARTHLVHCSFLCPVPVLLGNQKAANQLYRIAQEALQNALRHSRARRITLRLSESGESVRLTILDNGCGQPAELPAAAGMGLRVMGYRAGLIGGELHVQPRRSGGTEVVCRVAKRSLDP